MISVIWLMVGMTYTTAFAQDAASALITWNVSHLKDLNTGKEVVYQCTFTTQGTNAIRWLQKNDYLTLLDVQSVSGNWPNVQSIGKIVFNVNADTESGTITFERTATEFTATFDISRGQASRMKMKYSIVSLN